MSNLRTHTHGPWTGSWNMLLNPNLWLQGCFRPIDLRSKTTIYKLIYRSWNASVVQNFLGSLGFSFVCWGVKLRILFKDSYSGPWVFIHRCLTNKLLNHGSKQHATSSNLKTNSYQTQTHIHEDLVSLVHFNGVVVYLLFSPHANILF